MADQGTADRSPSGDDDVIREPDNSTVDDWLGQRVARDEQLIDEAMEETGGDRAEAEQRFEASDEGDDYHHQHVQGSPAET
jgi:hypothetical protein